MLNLQSIRSQLVFAGKNVRNLSSSSQLQPRKSPDMDKAPKEDGKELTDKPNIKAQIDTMSKGSNDNFLIEFRDKKPTYDQLFEYTINEKPYNIITKEPSKSWISGENLIKHHKKYDLSWDSMKSWYRTKMAKENLEMQVYNVRRHGILGPDLATAHFVTARGGKVRFKHKPDFWVLDDKTLPNVFDKKYRLLSVDASNMALVWEGIDNVILLHDLEELHLCNNRLDDFACDKLARIFRNSQKLEYLDLSGNKNISHRGIEVMYKIPKLKRLIIKDTKAAEWEFLDLLILMLQDLRPDLEVIYKD